MARTHKEVQERNARILKDLKGGLKLPAVARKYGLSEHWIYQIGRAGGINPRGKILSSLSFVVLYQLLHARDRRQTAIAAKLGVSRQYVNQVAAVARAAGFKVPQRFPHDR